MKKSFWKLSLSFLLVGSACLYSFPVQADSSVTQQQQQLATTLQQLIATLTAQLQQLEQQLAAQQSSSIATTTTAANEQNSSIIATSLTSRITFTDSVIEATSAQPTLYNGQFTTAFYFKTLTPNGVPIPNKHLYINGAFYSSDESGTIGLSKTSYTNSSWQFTVEDEGLPVQSQTITVTPPSSYTLIPSLNYTDPCAPNYIGPAIKYSLRGMCA